jgi:hypothetical protein
MSVNVVQTQVKTLLDGLELAFNYPNLVTYITPPNPGKLTGPAAYVWATTGSNARQTAPRGLGFRKTDWSVSIWLMSPGIATDPDADTKFASVIDSVTKALVTAPMPVTIADPVSNDEYQVLAIGEKFTITQAPVHALADQRLLMYEAMINLTVEVAASP